MEAVLHLSYLLLLPKLVLLWVFNPKIPYYFQIYKQLTEVSICSTNQLVHCFDGVKNTQEAHLLFQKLHHISVLSAHQINKHLLCLSGKRTVLTF